MRPTTTIVALLSSILLLTIVGGVFAVDIPPMPPLKTFYLEVPIAHGGAPNCLIAVPSGADYAQLGSKIAAAIKKVSGATLSVMDAATVSPETLRSSNMILLGYFANNPLVNYLYDEHYISLDTEWPGRGDYVIRTVHDPLGKGTCFVYLGGADLETATKAADDFIASLPEKGDVSYPHTIKIVQGGRPLTHKPNPDAIAAKVESAKGMNFRAVASMLNGAVVDYYLTGNPDDVELFRQLVPVFHEIIKKMGKVGDARGAFDLFNMWDNMEEAPGLSEEDRTQTTALLWEFANKFAYGSKPPEELKTPPGNDWDSRVAWDIARYFKKYYDLDVVGLLAWSDARFQGKAKFWRSNEDCPGYGGMTIYDTFYYALSAHYDEWFDSGMARQSCDYGMAVMNNLGGHAGFGDTSSMGEIGYWSNLFMVAAWRYRDGRYLYAYDHCPGLNRGNFSYNTYRQDVVKAQLPEDMLGVHVIPLPDWVYENRNSVLGTAPSEMNPVLDADPTPPQEECFDKITFRTSFEPEDQYLIVGGISHGYHAHPDGNSIIEFTDKRRYCLFDSGYFVPDTVEHNTLVVYRDGLFEPIPRLTGLSAVGDFENVGMTQTYLNGYNGVNWRRNIMWKKNEYFLVIDEVQAEEAGNYGMNAVFRTVADSAPQMGADRVSAVSAGKAFNIVSASHTPFKTTSTTPPTSVRHAIIEAKSVQMQPGDKQYFANMLYCAYEGDARAYEIVPAIAGTGTVMVRSPEGYAFAGTGKSALTKATPKAPDLHVDAAVFYIAENSFALTGGKALTIGNDTWVDAPNPINIAISIGKTATGTIETKQDTPVVLHASGEVKIDGKPAKGKAEKGGVLVDVPAGKHSLAFVTASAKINVGDWKGIYAAFEEQHKAKLADLKGAAEEGKAMQAAWKNEAATMQTRTVYVNAAGQETQALHKTGKATCWTEAQRGARARDAVDGDPESYCAVSGGAAWISDLPKDLGVQWDEPAKVGSFQIDYYNATYGPTDKGQQLQAWDGENWYPVEAEITKDESGANWTYVFKPVETTRMRVFITEFNGARTAVREMRIFGEPATPQERTVRIPERTNGLAVYDVDGDGKAEILAAVGNRVKCIRGDGTLAWEKELPKGALCVAAYDLDNDGKGEVAVGGKDHKLYCFDYQGNERWSVLTPADPYFPEVEPATGEIKVVGCADTDGDGDGEIVIGSSNWFAYCYDHTGNKVWGVLNWAHQPTSIAFAKMGNNKLAAFIGNTYCSANAFGPDGKGVKSVSVGYHGAAMSVAAGDMDGNGKDELIAGSRVGGVHCNELGSDKAWAKFMGAEVSQVTLADLTGDGKLELVAGSKNFHLLVTDADGAIVWSKNVGEAIMDLVTADVNGDGTPEIIVGTEGGMVRVVDAKGNILSTLTTGGNVTKVVAADLNGDGKIQIVAGCDDGFIYGGMK